jgi:probable F420-dependent oxidoreductase
MRFGFSPFPFARFRDIEEIADVARLGDELGFDALMLPEHLLPPAWPEADMSTKLWHDFPTLAAYLAGVTRRIRFISGVTVVPYHPPIPFAKALATLDVVSGGRVGLGAGTGWMGAEFRRLGIPFEERGAITDEYLRAMKELWTSDAPRFAGKYVSFDDVSFYPKPVQKPHIPIYVGGTGPRPYQRVAELGDGWYPMTATIAEIRAGLADIRRRMERLGRDSSNLWVGFGVGMGHDPETAKMRAHVGTGGGAVEVGATPRKTPAEAISEITALRDAGVNFVSVGLPWQAAGELNQGLRDFARDVMPAFAD